MSGWCEAAVLSSSVHGADSDTTCSSASAKRLSGAHDTAADVNTCVSAAQGLRQWPEPRASTSGRTTTDLEVAEVRLVVEGQEQVGLAQVPRHCDNVVVGRTRCGGARRQRFGAG